MNATTEIINKFNLSSVYLPNSKSNISISTPVYNTCTLPVQYLYNTCPIPVHYLSNTCTI